MRDDRARLDEIEMEHIVLTQTLDCPQGGRKKLIDGMPAGSGLFERRSYMLVYRLTAKHIEGVSARAHVAHECHEPVFERAELAWREIEQCGDAQRMRGERI